MQGWPWVAPGQRIGLLGGSFDPAHDGHVHITQEALTRFGLDRVWWLVSPGNPLKSSGPAPLAARMAHARGIMRHPRVRITDVEVRLGTRYTADTLTALVRRYPKARFVWLMGADNLAQFDQWQNWQGIMSTMPVGILARPGDRISARLSKTARIYRHAKLPSRAARVLPMCSAPMWCFTNMPMSPASSTAIRARGEWQS